MTEKDPNVIYTKDVDYLDEDKPIRNQNYVCLSFLSPEEVLANKDVFYVEKFLDRFSKDMDALFNGLRTKYPDDADMLNQIRETNQYIFNGKELQEQFRFFKEVNSGDLEKEFHEKNDFRTSIRGIKVRGVFDTLKEAQNRADFLKKSGDKFDIFVGQVGCWCPWSPNPYDMEDVQYAEAQLNTLMSKYKENAANKDIFFEERKNAKIEDARAKLEKSKVDSLEQPDPWTQRNMVEVPGITEEASTSETTENNSAPSE